MKILTWNCGGAFRKKFDSLAGFNADILVIQECEDPSRTRDKRYQKWAKNSLWVGENKNKGLGIFANDGTIITNLEWETNQLKYFISCRVNDEFNLLGAWCHGANSPTFGYIGQLWKYLQLHKTKLRKSIIAGDFNSNVFWDRWDRWWNHSDVVRELKEHQIESLYHHHFKEEQGKETSPTFYLHKKTSKPYHIDYIFASDDFLTSLKTMEIGTTENWLDKSDHMPVICEFE